jgi:hypothetical protein
MSSLVLGKGERVVDTRKKIVAAAGVAILGVLLYPPVVACTVIGGCTFDGHREIWEMGRFEQFDFIRIAVYLLVIAIAANLGLYLARK